VNSYDEIYDLFEALQGQIREGQEHSVVERLGDCLAVGLTPNGEHCIFLMTQELTPNLPSVRQAHQFRDWQIMESGESILANRLLFEAGVEYQALTCTVIVELYRNLSQSADNSLHAAFNATEPLIDILLQQAQLSRSELLGLFGELFVVRRFLSSISEIDPSPYVAVDPTCFWQGARRGARDIEVGLFAIEVKATTKSERCHHFHGFAQTEPRDDSETLLVASLCLAKSPTGTSTIDLVSQIRALIGEIATKGLEDVEQADQAFLDRLAEYGASGQQLALDSLDERTRLALSERYELCLPMKFYQMADPNLRILRVRDLDESFRHMRRQGFECEILLPDQIPGSPNNPTGFEATRVQFLNRLCSNNQRP
jgi:hypothetical protein